MENSETTIPVRVIKEGEIPLDDLLFLTIQRLGLDKNSIKYNYDEVVEIMKKYLTNQLNFLDLIKPEEIFDLFLLKFKTDILGEELNINKTDEKE